MMSNTRTNEVKDIPPRHSSQTGKQSSSLSMEESTAIDHHPPGRSSFRSERPNSHASSPIWERFIPAGSPKQMPSWVPRSPPPLPITGWTPVDPWKYRVYTQKEELGTIFSSSPTTSSSLSPIRLFAMHTRLILAQSYLSLLFRLPSFYLYRVERVFNDAQLSESDIRQMGVVTTERWRATEYGSAHDETDIARRNCQKLSRNTPIEDTPLSPALRQFRNSWNCFINTMMKEWNTLNIVTALLLTAILSLLQIESAGSDPATRTVAVMSFMCGTFSLMYGCVYITRFGAMRGMHKAYTWYTQEKNNHNFIWNMWLMLSLPLVWATYSIVLFIIAMMLFMWRTSSSAPDGHIGPPSPAAALGNRIGVTIVLGLGVIYFIGIGYTFTEYGADMDRKWQRTVQEAATYTIQSSPPPPDGGSRIPYMRNPSPVLTMQSDEKGSWASPRSPSSPVYRESPAPSEALGPLSPSESFPPLRLFYLGEAITASDAPEPPPQLIERQMAPDRWQQLISDLAAIAHSVSSPENWVFTSIWAVNSGVVGGFGVNLILCLEKPSPICSEGGSSPPVRARFSVWAFDATAKVSYLTEHFSPIPDGLDEICLIRDVLPSDAREKGIPMGLIVRRADQEEARIE